MDVAVLISIFALVATVSIAFRELGWRGTARTGATLLVVGVVFWSEPVQRTLFLGQVELMLMGVIVWDLSQPDSRRWKGIATGLAAGVKLVPLIFILYLVITRRSRQALAALAAFAATVLVGFAALPGEAVKWWFHGYFLQANRTGFVGDRVNQSLRGILTRLAGSVASAQPVWLVTAIAIGVLGLAAATLIHRAGHPFVGLMTCALTAVLISPISWDHHWVWIAPGLAVLLDAAVREPRRRSRALWLAAAATMVGAFVAWPGAGLHLVNLLHGGLFWYAPGTAFGHGDNPAFAEYHWHGVQLLAGNLYVLVGTALFVVAVLSAGRMLRARALDTTALAPA